MSGAPLVQAGAARPDEVRRAVDEVLAAPEFAGGSGPLPTLWERFVRFVAEHLPDLPVEAQTLGWIAQACVWLVLVVLGFVVVRALVRAASAPSSPAMPLRSSPALETRAARVARLRSEARAADARGEHALALRLEFTALVCALGERGDLEYRDAFTNRELLERGRPRGEADAQLRPLVPVLDRKSFGGEPATHEDFARLAALFERLAGGARA
ncbi:MAG: DUF4129 domain-containing protein [Planctomycetes bacterium]|nr:DUF4129 domain-containing protein [Planctomycetota bacterium]